eukprot:4178185-Alexandrium_andersonii.AAC.1
MDGPATWAVTWVPGQVPRWRHSRKDPVRPHPNSLQGTLSDEVRSLLRYKRPGRTEEPRRSDVCLSGSRPDPDTVCLTESALEAW